MGSLGQKFFLQKYAENESTRRIKLFCAKTVGKNSQYSRNKIILKIDHFGKTIAHAKWAVWVKIFFFKNMPKMNLQEELNCSAQKTAGKNSQYSRKETILKIDHFGKSIAHAKWAVWVKNSFLQKDAENESTRTI